MTRGSMGMANGSLGMSTAYKIAGGEAQRIARGTLGIPSGNY